MHYNCVIHESLLYDGAGQFDPASFQGQATIALSQLVGSAILPGLIKKLNALEVLRQTDYLMPAPACLLQQGNTFDGITGRSIPRESKLHINYALVTHKRIAKSPLHNRLWDQIINTIADMRASLGRKTRERSTARSANALH